MPTSLAAHLQLLAKYNRWLNRKLYAAAAGLPRDELLRDRGVFLASIQGLLQHLVEADMEWLRRFSALSAGDSAAQAALVELARQERFEPGVELSRLQARREALDAAILQWVATLGAQDLQQTLRYSNTKGQPLARDFHGLLLHFFVHQVHHRGQVVALLNQAGVDVPVTDLIAILPDAADTGA